MEEQEAPLAPATTATHAWQLLRLHRPQQALELAELLLARDPAGISAHLVRTEALRQLGRLPEAAVAAKAAITAAPQSAAAFKAFAQVRGQQGELAKAEKLTQEALRLDPGNASYYGFLAQLHYLQRRWLEAIATATAGLRAYAQHPDCLLWRALAQEAHGQPAAADADFARVLRAAPNNALVHEWRGRVLLGRYEAPAAGQHLAAALQLAPGNTAVLLLLRQAYRQQQWPAWLRRQHQLLRQDWRAGRPFSWRSLVVGPCTPLYAARSWWRTRHHALFQQRIPGLRRALLRKWLTLAALIVVPLGLLYAIIAFELPPYTLIILLAAIVRGLMGNSKQPS
jgi:tetratricopeptide (TPR) repeat protein